MGGRHIGAGGLPRSQVFFALEIGRGKVLGMGTKLGEGGHEQRISVETSWDCSAKLILINKLSDKYPKPS